jgi:AraC-like DNA-binding protein
LFAIANSVYHTGLETTNFFTKPFKKEFKKLPEEVLEAYALETEEFLKFALK